ncbi:EAL domain-containing protein [Sphingomonas sp. CD22]|uniref:putative bifunctional diguanylate cyclase/phosphodiesterase n=1 Tax=Sphingomonas sp. CD22 TaxID=3100214 RepID=UPI002ADF6C9D|nr:EAL domain-containing protein [Sphingomonas sp. CD22]MEA1086323.1 EAL domain-containing protein [Sphingomonas sp. CD22]
MALTLLAIGLSVGNKIHQADLRITLLSDALGREDRLDQVQRQLRQDVGRLTRDAEHGVKVPDARWAVLHERIAQFRLRSLQAAQAPDRRLESGSGIIQEGQQAVTVFAAASDHLIETSRLNPSGIKTAMPHFLGALTALEMSRSQARKELTLAIGLAAESNRRNGRRDIISVLLGGLGIVAIIFSMAIWLRRRLVLPITIMAARLREFQIGESDRDVPGLERPDELGDLARGLHEYRKAVESRRTAERRAEFLANHDMLTGLANRLLFENRLAHELGRSARTGDVVAVFAIDLDAFKAINDRLGHAGGDRVLKRTAQLLSSCVRGDDLVARIGGDEFAVIQVARSQPAATETLISRIFKMASAPSDEGVAIKMSVGVALSEPGQTGDELHELADLALYRAKADGRNTARIYNKHLKDEESRRVRLARDLENAVSANEFRLAFQPIADVVSLKIVGYEALLRWRHPILGDIPPDIFIPIAESSGLIRTIGSWVIDNALRVASTWDSKLSLAINLSPIQFRSDGLVTELCDSARRWRVAFDRLELEVTESATLLGFQRDNVLATLGELGKCGAKIVMDDFGTGHSSLSNLKEFTFDKIKIDRSFVATMHDNASSSSIVKATIGLGKSLGLIIVAEGVETEEQLFLLQQWGCDQVQGFLIGKPAELCSVACVEAVI